MNNYHNISYATIILRNMLLATNEIYLGNHIKVYRESQAACASSAVAILSHAEGRTDDDVDDKKTSSMEMRSAVAPISPPKGHVNADDVGTSSLNEIKYFTQVLYEKLDECLKFLVENSFNRENCGIVVKFIRVLCNIKFNDDAFSTVATELSLTLYEHRFLIKYYHITSGGSGADVVANTVSTVQPQTQMEKNIQIEIFKFLLLHRVDKSQLINVFVGLLDSSFQTTGFRSNENAEQLFQMFLEKYSNEKWSEDEAKLIFSRNLLNILIKSNYSFVVDLCEKWKFADAFIQTVLKNLDVINVVSSFVYVMLLFF